ncbi:MAG: hypothetical protein MJK04_18930 [Psychrosphaera sp.]|nr:hypothetical protein [Psychrosphaera sp.]
MKTYKLILSYSFMLTIIIYIATARSASNTIQLATHIDSISPDGTLLFAIKNNSAKPLWLHTQTLCAANGFSSTSLFSIQTKDAKAFNPSLEQQQDRFWLTSDKKAFTYAKMAAGNK